MHKCDDSSRSGKQNKKQRPTQEKDNEDIIMAPQDGLSEKYTDSMYRTGCSRCISLEQQLADLHAKHSTKHVWARRLKRMRVPYTVELHEPKAFAGVVVMALSAVGVFMFGLVALIAWVQNGIDFSVITPSHYRAFAVFVLCVFAMLAPVTKFKRRDDNS